MYEDYVRSDLVSQLNSMPTIVFRTLNQTEEMNKQTSRKCRKLERIIMKVKDMG